MLEIHRRTNKQTTNGPEGSLESRSCSPTLDWNRSQSDPTRSNSKSMGHASHSEEEVKIVSVVAVGGGGGAVVDVDEDAVDVVGGIPSTM